MLWLWWTAARGADVMVTEADFDQMVIDMIPVVAQAAGRTPPGRIRSSVDNRRRLLEILSIPPPPLGGRRPDPVDPTLLEEQRRQLLEGSIALYIYQVEGIFLIEEALAELVEATDLTMAEQRALVRCIVAHELVHALQHAYGADDDPSEDQARGRVALLEGHATAVELRLCEALEGPAIARLTEDVSGIPSAAVAPVDHPVLPYLYGRALVEGLDAEDPERIWSALAGPGPSWEAIVDAVRPVVGGGWEQPQWLVEALHGVGMAAAPEPASIRVLDPLLAPGPKPRATAGWWAVSPSGDRLGVFRLAPGEPAAVVAMRREGLRARDLFLLTDRDWILDRPRLPTPISDDRADAGLRWVLRNPRGKYVEHWLASSTALVVHASGPAGRPNRQVRDVLATLLAALPPGRPATEGLDALEPLGPWLAQVRDTPAPTLPGADWRLLQAANAERAGEERPCRGAFEGVWGPEVADAVRETAYLCAMATGDLELADQGAEALTELDAAVAAGHAWQLVEVDRVQDAFDLLDRLEAHGDAAVAVTDARMGALVHARRFEELARVALAGGSPQVRVQAAEVLLQVGRAREAREVLSDACPQLDPAPPACE
jgi:hypothetical protein